MPKNGLKITIFAFLALIISCRPLFALAAGGENGAGTPKIANYYLKYEISDEEASELSRWDVVILDMETAKTSPDQLAKIRELNPKIKIIAYVTSEEILEDVNSGYAPLRADLRAGIKDNYWLKDPSGNQLSFWPGTLMLNGADTSADSWNSYLANFVNQEVKGSGYFDGVFLDNLWTNISWFNGGNLDLNGDHQKDKASEADAKWLKGSQHLLAQIRAKCGKNFLIMSNGQADKHFEKDLNGRLLENFPALFNGASWTKAMSDYQLAGSAEQNPKLVVLNSYAKNQNDFRKFRFGLASTLMANGYYSFDYDVTNHGQTWWYDEYDAKLGAPQGDAYNLLSKNSSALAPGLWRRDFEKGIAVVNSTNKTQTYSFHQENFEKLQGTQDVGVNNGDKTNWVKLAPGDGIILLKKSTEIIDNVFVNGDFVRVLNDRNQQVQNGFFAYLNNFPGSAKIIVTSLNSKRTIISAVAGDISVTQNSKVLKKFTAYSDKNKNIVSLAVGDLYGNGQKEIIVGAGKGNDPWVKVFNAQGKQLAKFNAFDSSFKGGVSVAVADLDGDGKMEIVTGSGAGLNSEVRVFSNSGQLENKFSVFEPGFQGGVNIATGDVNGDGQAEIVVGAGPGGGPQVAIYNGDGQLQSQFFAYDKDFSKGVRVAVSDVNGDGQMEILAGIINF